MSNQPISDWKSTVEQHRSVAVKQLLAGGVIASLVGSELAQWGKDLITGVPFLGAYLFLVGTTILAALVLMALAIPGLSPSQASEYRRPLRQIVRQPVFAVATTAALVGQGTMNLLMTATPIAMVFHCGHAFGDSAFVIAWHGPTLPGSPGARDVGTDIFAAREGVVFAVESANYRGGLDTSRPGARANVVQILHDDGTYAVYAHLNRSSIRVRPGDQVQRGEYIAESGNTGFSTGPHLHFAVLRNAGMRLESVPVVFEGQGGAAIAPSTGDVMTAY